MPVLRAEATRDRFAECMVGSVQSFCSFQKRGCIWIGKRGDAASHIVNDCPCVTVSCPSEGCGVEAMRCEMQSHLAACCKESSCECPFGCGQHVDATRLQVCDICLVRKRYATVAGKGWWEGGGVGRVQQAAFVFMVCARQCGPGPKPCL